MHFGSKYVYYYRDGSDSESVSGSDSEGEVSAASPGTVNTANYSLQSASVKSKKSAGSGIFNRLSSAFSKRRAVPPPPLTGQVAAPPPPPPGGLVSASAIPDQPPPPAPLEKARKRKKIRKADPNVISLGIGELVVPENLQQSEKYQSCHNCSALMTGYSTYTEDNLGGTNCWRCEFCGHRNLNFDTSGWSKPASDDITYLVEAPPKCEGAKMDANEDDHMVIFCVDISGSMSTTTEVRTGSRVNFISRLDAVKTAVEHQIAALVETSPKVKVGLITFGTIVYMHGDGTKSTVKMNAQSQEMGEEEIKDFGRQHQNVGMIKDTKDILTKKVLGLQDEGMTALGPALLCAISVASGIKGSKVVICTDGLANRGFGTLPSRSASEQEVSSCRTVYRRMGQYAVDNDVSVSVISLEGADCQLVQLGLVAQMTGGFVDIVDQSNLSDQFGNILSSRTLATEVTATLLLHHTLYIRDPENENTEQQSRKEQRFGNVTTDTDLAVEFGVRRPANENEEPVPMEVEDQQGESGAAALADSDPQPSELPFQVQVRFTARDGAKYLRAVTSLRQKTENRDEAEKEMDVNILGAASSAVGSTYAIEGQTRKAKGYLKAHMNLAQRSRVQKVDLGMLDEDDALGYDAYGCVVEDMYSKTRSVESSAPARGNFRSAALCQNLIGDSFATELLSNQTRSKANFSSAKRKAKK